MLLIYLFSTVLNNLCPVLLPAQGETALKGLRSLSQTTGDFVWSYNSTQTSQMNVVCVCVCKAGEKASHRSLMTTVPSGVKNRTRILSCLLSLRSHCWAITCFLINASKHDSDRPIVSSTIAPSLLKSLRSAPLGCLFIQKYITFFIPWANGKSFPQHREKSFQGEKL